uniref:hypothetical protein n=1 Tax=Methylobacterium nigriterrae TaxID=3127512 RepID=UPI003013634D
MPRPADLMNDPSFRYAVEGARTAVFILMGQHISRGEGELIVTLSLLGFASAGGLSEENRQRLVQLGS